MISGTISENPSNPFIDGVLQFHVASLYPLLYRLEKRELIQGRWVEKAGQRRRRYYRLTAQGRQVLADQRQTWAISLRRSIAWRRSSPPGESR